MKKGGNTLDDLDEFGRGSSNKSPRFWQKPKQTMGLIALIFLCLAQDK
jgi:hypothetical protein